MFGTDPGPSSVFYPGTIVYVVSQNVSLHKVYLFNTGMTELAYLFFLEELVNHF